MVNSRTLKKLENNGGITLRNGKPFTYKRGYQVGLRGQVATTPAGASKLVRYYKGNCGVWLSNGVYYVDESYHFTTLRSAMAVGKVCEQMSIYDWKNDKLIWVED